MKLQRIGLTALFTLLTTLSFGDFPVISNSQSKSLNGLALAQTPEARKAEADRLLQQGNQQLNSNQFEAALQPLQQALAVYKEIGDRQREGTALLLIGTVYTNLKNFPLAIEYLKQSLQIARLTNNPNLEMSAKQILSLVQIFEAERLLQQGIQQLNTNQFEAALQSLQQALAISQEIGYRLGQGKALLLIGGIYIQLNNFPRAIESLEQSLQIARAINNPEIEKVVQEALSFARSESNPRIVEAYRLLQQGIQHLNIGQIETALQSFQQALIIFQEIKNREGEGAALRHLGVAYRKLGNYLRAIEYSKQSLAIAREMKDRKGEGAALGNLGNSYFALGDYLRAIEYSKQSLVIAREMKDRKIEGPALVNLGLTYLILGDYPQAINYTEQILVIAREIKDREGEGAALGNLGLTYLILGDYPQAINYTEQKLAITREIKDREGEGIALGNLGSAYLKLGDYPRAIKYFEQWLGIAREIKDRRNEGVALGNLGATYLALTDYSRAIKYSEQWLAITREIKDPQNEGNALGNLGFAYLLLSDYPQAVNYFQQVLAINREIKDRQNEGKTLTNLGEVLFKSGNLAAAETTLTNAIEVYESLRGGLKDSEKISIFETQSSPYRTLQQVLVAQNKTDTALEISERGRARAFVELLTQRLSPNSQKTSPETNLKPKIAQIQQIAKAQNATLVQYSITYDNFQIQGKQQSKESELYIWVIKPTGEIIFRKADLKPLWQQKNTTLRNLVINSRESIGARGRATVEIVLQPTADQSERLQQLHEILIEPISDLLPTDPNSRVIFVPQSSLFLVPFPALKDKSGKYLIEKHTILTAPSIQVLELTRQQKQKSRTTGEALVVGNPIMPTVSLDPGKPPQQLIPLPGAEREAIAIAPLLKTQAITGSLGTKANVVQRMSTARIIHLATHGLLDDFRGLGSAIAFTPSGNDNGLLTAEEILDLKLSADLVVLSACDTGRGRITGDGVVGLSRALISAGVPSVIVSLWAVPDAPTAQLMTAFYQNLQTNPDKAQALRQAMLTMMKTYPNPKDWAAFTLIGEAE
ncbi:CHAT domain-containing protein [Aerosakkonemataceae cyanobacterium BLCC-F50]|uniref:CHAT domain-containing protein n=1 Tax=Floridaenema flaviceps BLCC-F50 TaxID=3153642 RepID=A0ABV4Y3D5_9CYAN